MTRQGTGRANDHSNALARLRAIDHEIQLLEHTAAVLGWDEETQLPELGIDERSEQMALLRRIIHGRLVAPEIPDLLGELGASEANPMGDPALPDLDRAFLRAFCHVYNRERHLPEALVSDGGSIFKAKRAMAIYAALGFHGKETVKFQFSFKYRLFGPAGNIPAPVRITPILPKPKPATRPETYSVVVNNVNAQELLFALARDLVASPQTLYERMEAYLKEMRELESCAI